jgi:DNA-binding SARP family transcriptional activator/tetratricopeptide (TPR) repeat protein
VEFLVLGPLEVRSARESFPLGGPRLRAVLADLILHTGSVLPMDTLIDDLWGGKSPPTAEAVVQNAVMKLRKTLGRDVIETRPPGYMLAVDPGAIDSHRFERLVRDARPLPPAERSSALRDALALWRGSAYSDLAFESFLQEEIARLDELRLTALEERLEAELELGRHDAVVPEASLLADQHPARERLCRILMLALYRAGRQQEALDAYEELRRTLDELFGIEPSPETRALHLMILNQDPAIASTPEAPRPVGAVRRPVALLVVELLLDEDLELETAGSALDETRRALAEVAGRHGGSLSPGSGVELIAAFGAEAAHEDDVLRAARSAVELHEMLAGREVDARLAVGTGRLLVEDGRPVLVGAVVAQTRRALHDADAGDVLVTPAAARVGGDALELDADGRLLGVRPGRPRPSAASAPLVGRSAELAGLRAAFDRVVETGRPQHVVLVGEAGIGKSRLIAGLVEGLPAVVLQAACIPYGEGISFLPLRDLYEGALALDDRAPVLEDLTSAEAALPAARTLFEHFTRTGPLVVVLEDLHWAMPTFLDVVEYAVRAVNGPLLIVSSTRPELLGRRPAWGRGATVLHALAGEDARSLVDALPEREALDERLTTSILEAAEGVPLFVEQLAAYAAEWGLDRDRMPPTLEALLASRIDALEPGERDVLSRAAVVGRTFSRDAIAALMPNEGLEELDGRLSSLARGRFVRSHGSEHEFVHPLVLGAAYDAIGRIRRAEMHEGVARWLDRRDESEELVGTHLERAVLDTPRDPQRDALAREASARLGRAGERALHASDHAAAANLLERAAALLAPGDVERLELECHLGHALKGLGEYGLAIDVLSGAAARAEGAGDRRLELRARLELTPVSLFTGRMTVDDATTVIDDAVRDLGDSGDALGVARAMRMRIQVADWAGRYDEAFALSERVERAYRALGLSEPVTQSRIGYALEGSSSFESTVGLGEELMASHPHQFRVRAYLRAYIAFLRTVTGDIEAGRAEAAVARSELEAVGEELGLHTTALRWFGSLEAFALDWARAKELFASGLAYVRDRPQHVAWHAYHLARLAEAAVGASNVDHAARLADEARALTVAGDVETEIWWRRVAARTLSLTGHPRKATRLGREAVTLADGTDGLLFQGESRLDLAEVLLRTGRPAEAAAFAREGLALLDRKGAVLPASNGRARFADLLDAADEGAATAAPSAGAPSSPAGTSRSASVPARPSRGRSSAPSPPPRRSSRRSR